MLDVDDKGKPKLSKAARDYFAQQGAIGGRIGGKQYSESLTPQQRSDRARHAAQARWSKNPGRKPKQPPEAPDSDSANNNA